MTTNNQITPHPAVGDDPLGSEMTTADSAGAAGASSERGQTTAEYALVLLAAGSIAMMVVAWAQGTGAIGELFDSMLSRITSLAA